MVKTDKRLRLCITLIVCNVLFIWGNSAMPAQISAAISGFVRDIVSLLAGGGSGAEAAFGDGILRKIAHFVEFTCLGAGLCWLLSMLKKHRLLALIGGFLVACVDETIQCFVPGRGPRITDVLLDSAGVGCGILLLSVGYAIYLKKEK